MAKKTKSYDFISMQREKQRLMRECADYEKKLQGHIDALRNHPVRMAINSILPFGEGAKDNVIKGLDLLNDTILPVVVGATFKRGKDNWSKNLMQIVQAVVITYSFKFFKKILAKKKAKTAETPESSSAVNMSQD